jgi:hypothetical protein
MATYLTSRTEYDPAYAIVQAPLYSTLFILSRVQNPPQSDIDVSSRGPTGFIVERANANKSKAWLAEAESLGSDLTTVVTTSQEDCLFT